MNIATKSYESLLPFLVVEAISSQNFDSMSVRLMDKGWAWLVSGRKLIIWKFKESKQVTMTRTRSRALSPNFELQLPQSDLKHRAELIHVFFMPQNPNISLRAITLPAALAISPEGTIRFWSNIAHERFTETSAVDMQGQEFCALVPLSPLEYLLATTSGSIFLLVIDITSSDSKGMIVCTTLTTPSGLLSGISRRMTNLFFGPMPADVSSDSRRPLITVPESSDRTQTSDKQFFVLSSSLKLRHWSRTGEGVNSQNQLVREWDLQRNVHSKLVSSLSVPESQTLSFWPVDIISTKTKELLILLVTLDTSRDNLINYATCRFNPYQAGDTIAKLTILKSHSWNYTNESEEQLLALRFLERQINSALCFFYDRKFLFLARTDCDILDAVDFANQDDGILGAGSMDGQAILFTQRDGLICVNPVVSDRTQIETGNETTVRFESRLSTSNANISQHSRLDAHQRSNRVEPMLVELEEDDEENDVPRTPVQPRSRIDRDQSMIDKANLDNSNLNKSSDQSTKRKGNDVNEFIKKNKEFEWVQHIDAKRYGAASGLLAKLADDCEILKDRRDTLLALSKLAKLAE